MFTYIRTLFDEYYLDEISGVAGLLITIVGFVVTIYNIRRAKSAAQKANEAVQQVKDSMISVNTLSDVSAAIMILDEIKRLHRSKSWSITLDRYAYLRRNLSSINHNNPKLNNEHKACIDETISYLSNLEVTMERKIWSDITPDDVAKINKTLSGKADKIHKILLDLKLNER